VRLALENTLVVVQVEHAEALENIEEIATEERVDAVFLGPNDLSLSLGQPGDTNHPKVAAAVDRVVEAVVGSGTALCVIANSEEEARYWEERGARIVLYPAFALLGARLKEVLSGTRAQADADDHIDYGPDGRAGRKA
jgi:4-hydroxy-2-oxoheptanedioate aldolase